MSKRIKLRKVPGFEGYAVSADGRLWSNNGNKSKTDRKYRALKPSPDYQGYHIANMREVPGSKLLVRKLHRLVYAIWVGPIPNGYTINHKDTIKSHNWADNLEPLTHADNMRHAWANGCMKNIARGEYVNKGKFKEADVMAIRKEYSTGITSMSKLAVKFNTASSTICEIVNRKTWKHLA